MQVETVALPYTHYPHSVKGYLDNQWLDVISLNNWNFLETLENEALDYFEPQEPRPGHYPFLPPVFTEGGRMYAQPFIFSPVILCYNKSLLRQLGIAEPDSSWSWDDLRASSSRIRHETERFGFYAHISSTNRFPIVLLQEEFRFSSAGSESPYEDPRMWESLRGFRDLIYSQGLFPSFLSETNADAEKLFAREKAAMIMTTYYGLKYLRDLPFAYDLAPLPYNKNAKTLLLVTGLAVSRQSAHKDAARLLVDFLTSEESQLDIRKHTMTLPAHKASAEWTGPEEFERPSRFHLYREIIPTFSRFEDLNLPVTELSRLRNELNLFWSGLEEPEPVMQRLKEQYDRKVGQAAGLS
ncbi:extracellular solute-binding protein [Paenibacillus sp. CC-CFT747]|nr:extracellular solute-binding protein [Paenibacillus sp. CC-CFT747]